MTKSKYRKQPIPLYKFSDNVRQAICPCIHGSKWRHVYARLSDSTERQVGSQLRALILTQFREELKQSLNVKKDDQESS